MDLAGLEGHRLPSAAHGLYGSVDETPCGVRAVHPRLLATAAAEPPFANVLDSHPAVQAWQAELRTVDGQEEPIVFLSLEANGRPGRLLRQLDRDLTVTQFVVLDRRRLEARVSSHGDSRPEPSSLVPDDAEDGSSAPPPDAPWAPSNRSRTALLRFSPSRYRRRAGSRPRPRRCGRPRPAGSRSRHRHNRLGRRPNRVGSRSRDGSRTPAGRRRPRSPRRATPAPARCRCIR